MESLAFFPCNCDHKWTFPDYLCRTDPLPDVGLIKGLREGKGGGVDGETKMADDYSSWLSFPNDASDAEKTMRAQLCLCSIFRNKLIC